MEKAKTVKDPDLLYSGESQKALDNFVKQVNNVFLAKLLTYAIKQDKCQYVESFLRDILADNWETHNHQNFEIDNPQYAYTKLKFMFQK